LLIFIVLLLTFYLFPQHRQQQQQQYQTNILTEQVADETKNIIKQDYKDTPIGQQITNTISNVKNMRNM
jgi:hypothetical protein